ncbi:YlmC/YmxH family sporulation protein [Clostridium hydrogeniformans]|uniref:YlmC/YmxH family sporulation protein n=1 Tax=Clostridium hydrogeniformans TaxID=349933 RepID=UPI00048978EC|nr:YlmC/YmxH family sporulation protein [Clostridium hydrogeniformans]
MEINSMHSINQIKSMEVIDVNLGAKLGYIKDLKIDCDECRVVALVLPEIRASWFTKGEHREIPWNKVVKIGVDVILVDYEQSNSNDI